MPRPKGRKPKVDAIENAATEAEPVGAASPEMADIPAQPEPPDMTDPAWSDYALSHLTPEEKVNDSPRNPGLRRITALLCGPIVGSVPRTVQAASAENGWAATVEAHVTILWGGNPDDKRTFGDVADVSTNNTPPTFAKHASQSAFTKAESRAFKKALMLGPGVYTAEEMNEFANQAHTQVQGPAPMKGQPVEQPDSGMITLSQQRGIDKLCRECGDEGIDVNKYLMAYNKNYTDISKVPFDKAQAMHKHLNELRNDETRVPENIKGYNPNWREEVSE